MDYHVHCVLFGKGKQGIHNGIQWQDFSWFPERAGLYSDVFGDEWI